MKLITGLLLISSFSVLVSCSGNNNDQKKSTESETNNGKEITQTSTGNEQKNLEAGKSETYTESDISNDTNETENRPPRIKSIKIETITSSPRDGFRADIVSEDPDGDEVGYIYQWKHNGEEIFGATEDTLDWHDDFHKGDKLTIDVIPYDDEAEGIWKSEGSITIPNSPPVITSTPDNAVSGNKFNYDVIANDPDGDPITFTLKNAPEGMSIETDTGVINWEFTNDDAGDYSMDIVVTDSDGAYAVQNVAFSIKKP